MMRDKHIIETAQQIGWNIEHKMTNQMLVILVRQILADVQSQLREQADHIYDNDPKGSAAVRDCISLFDSWGE